MALKIEIGLTYNKKWNIRIGDVDGYTSHSMCSKEDVLDEIDWAIEDYELLNMKSEKTAHKEG